MYMTVYVYNSHSPQASLVETFLKRYAPDIISFNPLRMFEVLKKRTFKLSPTKKNTSRIFQENHPKQIFHPPKKHLPNKKYPPKFSKTSLHVDCIAILPITVLHRSFVLQIGYIKICQLPESRWRSQNPMNSYEFQPSIFLEKRVDSWVPVVTHHWAPAHNQPKPQHCRKCLSSATPHNNLNQQPLPNCSMGLEHFPRRIWSYFSCIWLEWAGPKPTDLTASLRKQLGLLSC